VSQEETGTESRGGEQLRRESAGRKLIFWNVAGVIKKDEEFWRYVKGFDFISLTETWMEGKGWDKLKDWLPSTHEWKMVEARKEKVKGRAKGGMLLGKRKGWGNVGEKD